MLDLAELSVPALICILAVLAASVSLSFRALVSGIKFASKLRPGASSEPGKSIGQEHKLPRLPQGWWTDPALFQLERRAIFSQTWICVSHRGRFVNPGDYVSHEVGGFRFFLILGKDNVVRAFHNVCRHRAFPVTPKPSGSSTILGCKYHGWCYDTKGQLTKAPQFDDIPGFEKSQNSLFQIHTEMDSHGFLHVNLSGSSKAPCAKPSVARKVGTPSEITHSSQFIYSWEITGRFNWKVVVDNVQSGGEAHHQGNQTMGIVRTILAAFPTGAGQLSFFPVTSVYTRIKSPFWYQVTFCPDSTQQTTLRCDVYSSTNGGSSKIEGKLKANLEGHIKSIVKYYEEKYAALARSEHNTGEIGGNQARILDAIEAHVQEERAKGKEINPAAVHQDRSPNFARAQELCQKVECDLGKLAW